MAMVNIVKDKTHLSVSSGAFRSIYQPSGWKLETDAEDEFSMPKTSLPPIGGNVNPEDKKDTADVSGYEDDDSEESDETSQDTADVSDDELTEKPLSDMSFEELKRYAEIMDIEVAGLKSKKEIRAAIREAM